MDTAARETAWTEIKQLVSDHAVKSKDEKGAFLKSNCGIRLVFKSSQVL